LASRNRRRRRHSKTSRWKKLLFVGAVFAVAIGVAGGAGAAWVLKIYNDAPSINSLKAVKKGRSSAIYDADGSLIGFIHSTNVRQPVSWSQIPSDLKNATVAIEDRNFYHHGGVDPGAIGRALVKDIEAGSPVQGGSTITQQLVRNLYIRNPQDTIKRKIYEASLANQMEDKHSKRWILDQYLNTAPYGTVNGETAVGAEAAAQTYYGKHASDLSLPEAAMIAGLPQAPSQYNPFLDSRAALIRRNEVLKVMEQQGYIDSQRYTDALRHGLGLNPGDKYKVIRDPYLYDLVQQELIDRYGVNTVRNGGLKAYTSIDPTLQDNAQSAVDSCGVCYSGGGPAAALASVDPKTGEIVALASSQGYSSTSQFNYAWQAHRQPGSSFKTFVLTTAIKQGIDPASTYYDGTSPKTLPIPGGGTWTVNNSEPGSGTYSLESATWDSVNAVFAQLALDVGPENITETAHSMGITSPLDSVPAEAIGGLRIGVTPLEMADAYATLANGGIHHDATAVSKVVFPGGKVDKVEPDSGKRVLTPGQAYDVTKVLEGVITQGTGAGYTNSGCSAAAGKTGTSEGESDAWFVGYTPIYSTAVWVGHPESRDATGFGGPTAGPIWASFMSNALSGNCPDFTAPSSLPSLSGLTTGYTTGGSSSSSSGSYNYGTSTYGSTTGTGTGTGTSTGGNTGTATPPPSPTPAPAPAPAPPSTGGTGGTP